MAEALRAMRHHVTAVDDQQFQSLPDGIVALNVVHSNIRTKYMEVRFDLHSTIQLVKEKISRHCGTSPEFQRLVLQSEGQPVCELDDNLQKLGFYSPVSGMDIMVFDQDPNSLSRAGGLEDVSQVKKYRMSDEEYDKRSGTMREWIRQQKEKDPSWIAPWLPEDAKQRLEARRKREAEEEIPGPESVQGMGVGDRCEVLPGGRRGQVKFLGEAPNHLRAGFWVGVALDEPMGKNDGSIKGTQYFECLPGHGIFTRPKNVTVGDFPERDLLDESDEDEM